MAEMLDIEQDLDSEASELEVVEERIQASDIEELKSEGASAPDRYKGKTPKELARMHQEARHKSQRQPTGSAQDNGQLKFSRS